MLRSYCPDCDDNVFTPEGACHECACTNIAPTRSITIREGHCDECGTYEWAAVWKGDDNFECARGHALDMGNVSYTGGAKISDFYCEGVDAFELKGTNRTVTSFSQRQRAREAQGLDPDTGMFREYGEGGEDYN